MFTKRKKEGKSRFRKMIMAFKRILIAMVCIAILFPSIEPFFVKATNVEAKASNLVQMASDRKQVFSANGMMGVIADDGDVYVSGQTSSSSPFEVKEFTNLFVDQVTKYDKAEEDYYNNKTGNIIKNILYEQECKELKRRVKKIYGLRFGMAFVSEDNFFYDWTLYSPIRCNNKLDYYTIPKFPKVERSMYLNKAMEDVVDVAYGHESAIALNSEGEVFAWGMNEYGEFGNGTINTPYEYTSVGPSYRKPDFCQVDGGFKYSKVTGDEYTMGGIRSDGTIWVWGRCNLGAGGKGIQSLTSSPQQIIVNNDVNEKFIDYSVSGSVGAAITDEGKLYQWGTTAYSNTSSRFCALPKEILPEIKFIQVDAGYKMVAALTEDNDLYMWGYNDFDAIPLGEEYNDRTIQPTLIMRNVIDIDITDDSGIALTKDGNVWTWGQNVWGKCGTKNTEKQYYPINTFNIYGKVPSFSRYVLEPEDIPQFNYDVNTYSPELATIMAKYAMLAYDETDEKNSIYTTSVPKTLLNVKLKSKPKLLMNCLRDAGYEDIEASSYHNNDPHDAPFVLGNRRVVDAEGKTRNQIMVCIKGTAENEWEGDMDLTGSFYSEDWKGHFSFLQAKNQIRSELIDYVEDNNLVSEDNIYLITGHSRGAAIANILAADLTYNSENGKDIYCYTYATPNVYLLSKEIYGDNNFSNIFNHRFTDDFVPKVPLYDWGYGVYGVTRYATAQNLYKGNKNFAHSVSVAQSTKAHFSKEEANKVVKDIIFGKWKTTKEYYDTLVITDPTLVTLPLGTLYKVMRNYVAKAAQGMPKEGLKLLRLSQTLGVNSSIKYIAKFFVRGGTSFIWDTHVQTSYYYATLFGLFEGPYGEEPNEVPYNSANTTMSLDVQGASQKASSVQTPRSNNLDNLTSSTASISSNSFENTDSSVNDVSANTTSGNTTSGNDLSGNSTLPYAKWNEYSALKTFALQGKNNELLGWNLDDCNTWKGVTFDEQGYVCAINLPGLELTGELDVSGFVNLITLDCSSNVLTKLEADDCSKLVNLQCYYNSLAELAINDCSSLVILDCSDNLLENLDLSTSINLDDFNCGSNQLLDITLPTTNKITSLHCEYNYLQDLSKFKGLEGDGKGIYCEPQQVRPGSQLASADVALLQAIMNQSPVEESLMWDANNLENCYGVQWIYKDGTYYIQSLNLSECEIEGTLSVSGLQELESFVLPLNKLQEVSIDNCAKLETIDLAGNQLKNIQLSNIPKVSTIDISYNYLPKSVTDEMKATYDIDSIEYRAEPQFVDADYEDFAQDELSTLKEFFERDENKEELYYLDFSDPGIIDEIKWELKEDGKYHVTNIDFSFCAISGKLDLSSFEYLQNAIFKSTNLQEVILPDSIMEIPDEAFAYCESLVSIVIPKNVTKIGSDAFNECEALRKVEFLCKNADIAFNAFNETYGIETVYCYGNTNEMNTNFFGNPRIQIYYQMELVDVDDSNQTIIAFAEEGDTIACLDEWIGTAIHKPGYKFAGWSTTAGGEVVPKSTVIPRKEGIKLYANWDKINIEQITLSQDSGIMKIGDQKQLEITVTPKEADVKEVTYSSDHEEIASVNEDGMITAHKEGQAMITIAANDIVLKYKVFVFNEIPTGFWTEQVSDYQYTGAQIKPELQVYQGTQKLVLNNDYKVSYKNNVNVSSENSKYKPTITINGVGNYQDTKEVTFNITPKKLTDQDIKTVLPDLKYTGKERKSVPTIQWGIKKLVLNTDYTVSYIGNITDPGRVLVVITGKGNYVDRIETSYNIYVDDLSKAITTKVESQVYSGQMICPKVNVSFVVGKETRVLNPYNPLTKEGDYEVEYSNNLNAGTASITIIGVNNYGGTKTIKFTILPKDLSRESIVLDEIQDEIYTGKKVMPLPIIKDGEVVLVQNKDYTLSYTNNISASNIDSKKAPLITIAGKGNYAGKLQSKYAILPKSISGNDCEIKVEDVKYNNGKPCVPKYSIYSNNVKLVKDKDFTIKLANNLEVGDAESANIPTLIFTGIGNYSGKQEVSFRIVKSLMIDASVDKIEKQIYTGVALTPKVNVYYGTGKSKKQLKEYNPEDKTGDYTLEYANNSKVGKAEINIVGKNDFGGNKKVTFDIVAKTVTNSTINIIGKENLLYSQNGTKPNCEVLDGELQLVEGVDYKVKYYNNKSVAKETDKKAPYIQITGIGNYGGTLKQKFTILPRKMMGEEFNVQVSDALYNQGKAVKPSVTVYDNNKKLINKVDYSLTYSDNTNVTGKELGAKVVITGMGNYENSIEANFRIYEKEISKVKVSKIGAVKYTGNRIEPQIELLDGTYKLGEGTDYTLEYGENTNVGTGNVVILGKGKYGGSKKVIFVILPNIF